MYTCFSKTCNGKLMVAILIFFYTFDYSLSINVSFYITIRGEEKTYKEKNVLFNFFFKFKLLCTILLFMTEERTGSIQCNLLFLRMIHIF